MSQDVVQSPIPPVRGRTIQDRRGRPSLMRNVLSNWGVLATAILYTLIITPTVVRALNQEAYGVWSFLNAFAAYSNLFYLGLGSALLRFGAEYHASGRRNEFNRLVSVMLTIYTAIAAFSLLLGLVAAPILPRLLAASNPISVSAAVVVLAARVGLMFVGSAFAGVLVAQGRTDLYCLVGICGNLSRLLIVPVAVRAPDPLSALALALAVTGGAEVMAIAYLAFRIDPGLKLRTAVPTAQELRTLYGFGTSAFLLQLADRLISYSDTIVIGVLLGASSVALYVLPLQLVEYGRMIIRGIVSVMLPHLSALLATGQSVRFARSYFRTLRTTALVGAFVSINLVALGPTFLRLWVGPELATEALPLLMCLAVACFAQAIAVEGQTPFFLALRKTVPAALVLLMEAVVNLTLSLVLARRFGIVGVALATAVPAVLVSGTVLTVRGARAVGVPVHEVLGKAIFPAFGFALTLAAVHAVLAFVLSPTADSIAVFMTKLVLSLTAGGAIGWMFIPHSDRRSIKVSIAHATLKGRRLAGRLWDEDAGLTTLQ